jgi:hypothetical protein
MPMPDQSRTDTSRQRCEQKGNFGCVARKVAIHKCQHRPMLAQEFNRLGIGFDSVITVEDNASVTVN